MDLVHKEKQERFLRLLEPQADRLSRFARAMAPSVEDARDLMSETILLAFDNLESLKHEAAFQSYLFTIAHRLNVRRSERGKRFGEYDEAQVLQIPDTHPLPDVRAEVRILYDALATLPERTREAIVLFEISGLSLEEVREIQGGSLSGVKSRIVRGREQLAKVLGIEQPKPARERTTPARTEASRLNRFLVISAEK
jgi:RNA polymerase sigma-70 factor (ECF subfamily)